MTRLQIEMDDEKFAELEQIMEECGLRTKKDLVNNAFTILDWAISERKKGFSIASIDESNHRIRELVLPIFSKFPSKSDPSKDSTASNCS